MKTTLSLALALMLLFVFAHPAASHEREIREPETDHVLYWIGRILYPIGHALDHILCGPHEPLEEEGVKAVAVEEQRPEKPKYNFSPRKKHPQEEKEESP